MLTFLSPSLVGLLLFYILPLLLSIIYAVTDNVGSRQFVGIQHFAETWKNPIFQQGLANTLWFLLIAIPLLLALSLFLALLIKRMGQWKGVALLFLIFPLVVPSGVCAFFWKCLFDTNGFINKILFGMNLPMVNWNNSPALLAIAVLIFLWKNVGFCAAVFFAGLKKIPEEYCEIAEMEGASPFQRFRYVTIVYLAPTTFLVLLLALVGSFRVFRELYILYGNYPSQHIYLLQHYMNNQFYNLNLQKLTASAYLLLVMIGAVLLGLFFAQRKLSDTFVSQQLSSHTTRPLSQRQQHFANVGIGIAVGLLLLPLLFMLSNSFMSSHEVLSRYTTATVNSGISFINMGWWPQKFSFEQYRKVLFESPVYLRQYWNSFLIVLPVVVGQCIVSCLGAYGFERIRWRHKETVFFLYILIMLLPMQVSLVPNYLVANWLMFPGYISIILPGIFAPLGVFWIRQQLKGFPVECIEVAQSCGASETTTFLRIVLPNLKPAISTLAVLTFAEYWNVVEQAVIFLPVPHDQPLSAALAYTLSENMDMFFAASCLYLVPPLLVFLYCKDYLVEQIAN